MKTYLRSKPSAPEPLQGKQSPVPSSSWQARQGGLPTPLLPFFGARAERLADLVGGAGAGLGGEMLAGFGEVEGTTWGSRVGGRVQGKRGGDRDRDREGRARGRDESTHASGEPDPDHKETQAHPTQATCR